jgi:N-acetylneuraminic acid mutarotase
LPLKVQEIYPALHRGRIHVAGGFRAVLGKVVGPTDEHHCLEVETGQWLRRAELPVALHHPQLVSFAGTLYCLGGFRTPSPARIWVMTDIAWRYDDAHDRWLEEPALPQPVAECMAGVLSSGMHLCGGRAPASADAADWEDHRDTNMHIVKSGKDERWEAAAPLPVARNSGASAVIDNHLHVVAGRTVERVNLRDHHVYDQSEDRWRTAAPLPLGQAGLAAAAVDGRLYAFGGEAIGDDRRVFPDSWIYEPRTDTWARLPDMPRPRHGHGAVAIGRDIYTLGGAMQVGGNETTDAVDILSVS